MEGHATLARRLGLPLLTLYGLGTMVGGGFYALLGRVVARSGGAAPLAFLIAAGIAALSAGSFAELAARHPHAAGPARYVQVASGRRWLAVTVGALVVATGVVSAAALARATGRFLEELAAMPVPVGVTLTTLLLGAVAAWGIAESVRLAAAITFVEVGGLLVVLVANGGAFAELPERWGELVTPAAGLGWAGVLTGGFLAFYAFIGFEDMVDVAEEVRAPERTVPRAILLSLVVTAALYIAVCAAAVLAVPLDELAESRAPLARLVSDQPGGARDAMVLVSILAGVNGALIQIVMAARIVYGLGKSGGPLAPLAAVNARTRTPVRATALMTAAVLALALGFPLEGLANATSAIILLVFAAVNASLVVLKLRGTPPPAGAPNLPLALPVLGAATSLGLVVFRVL